MRWIQAVLVSLTLAMMPTFGAAEEQQTSPELRAATIQINQSAISLETADVHQKPFRGFFGYLEYDFDPNAAEGVPGFGELAGPDIPMAQAFKQ